MLTSKREGIGSVELPSVAKITDSVQIGCSIHSLKSRDKFSAIVEIVNNCSVFEFLDEFDNKNTFLQEVFAREYLGTTGIGHNVAIPHGKCDIIDKVRIGLGVSKEGIDFGSIDGEPVHLVLVIGSNPANQVEYLKSLAFIMNHLKSPFLRSALINISSCYGEINEEPYEHFLNIMKSQIFSADSILSLT